MAEKKKYLPDVIKVVVGIASLPLFGTLWGYGVSGVVPNLHLWLLGIGGLNWGIVGLTSLISEKFDLVDSLFGWF
jgi:uncharacterized membrane protein YuzA (DUF378 family)